jgi:hypothetical protein
MKRKYAAMLVFGTEYSGWLAQSHGVLGYPMTCAKSNILWFRRRMEAYCSGCKIAATKFGGARVKVQVTTEEEVDAYLVMRTIHESTFPRPS